MEQAAQADQGTAVAPEAHLGRDNRLGTEKIGRLLFVFSLPAIVMMLFNSLYNIIDAAFLGNAVGADGIAVTTLTLPVSMLLMAFSSWAGQGGTALAAIQLGQGQKAQAERTLGNSTVLLIGLAALVSVGGMIFIDPLLTVLGTTPELWDSTKLFLSIILCGFIFQSLGMGLNSFLRTAGKPNFALGTTILGTVTCMVLNFLFVMVLGFGIAGSAFATILGQCVGMVPVIWFFAFNKKAILNLRVSCMKPDFKLQGHILLLGLASFLMSAASTVIGVVFNQLLVLYGAQVAIGSDGALSSIGLVNKIGFFAMAPLIGLTMGAQPIIGYNYGARQWHRVKKSLDTAIIASIALGTVAWIVMQVFANQLVLLFGVSGELMEYSASALRLYTILFPLIGFQMCGSSYFQSSGQPLKSVVLELTRQVIFLLPLYLVMPLFVPHWFPWITGLDCLVLATPVSDALSIVVTATFVILEARKLVGLRSDQTDFSDRPLPEA